jgi:hypothetical protein
MTSLEAEILRTHAAVKTGKPGAKRKLKELQARYREGGGPITRYYSGPGAATVVEPGHSASVTSIARTRLPKQPAKESLPFGHSYKDVELRETFVGYKVDLTPQVKEAILNEIRRAHKEAGEEIEAAGWLFAPYRPRAESDSIQVVHATRSGSARGSQTSVTLCDPIEAMAHVRSSELAHLHLCGDWHSHTGPGSELPSLQDARAWAGTMDSLGRSAYVSVIVSPNADGCGWMIPSFSAWVAGRYGYPSRPVVGRARIGW